MSAHSFVRARMAYWSAQDEHVEICGQCKQEFTTRNRYGAKKTPLCSDSCRAENKRAYVARKRAGRVAA